jgi:hypothetical protein
MDDDDPEVLLCGQVLQVLRSLKRNFAAVIRKLDVNITVGIASPAANNLVEREYNYSTINSDLHMGDEVEIVVCPGKMRRKKVYILLEGRSSPMRQTFHLYGSVESH